MRKKYKVLFLKRVGDFKLWCAQVNKSCRNIFETISYEDRVLPQLKNTHLMIALKLTSQSSWPTSDWCTRHTAHPRELTLAARERYGSNHLVWSRVRGLSLPTRHQSWQSSITRTLVWWPRVGESENWRNEKWAEISPTDQARLWCCCGRSLKTPYPKKVFSLGILYTLQNDLIIC